MTTPWRRGPSEAQEAHHDETSHGGPNSSPRRVHGEKDPAIQYILCQSSRRTTIDHNRSPCACRIPRFTNGSQTRGLCVWRHGMGICVNICGPCQRRLSLTALTTYWQGIGFMRPATYIKVYPSPSQALPFLLRKEGRKVSQKCESALLTSRLQTLTPANYGTYKANSGSILSNHAAYYSPTVAFSNSFNGSYESQYAITHRAIPPFAGIEIPSRLLQMLFSPTFISWRRSQ
ncbi:uncharacterized protein CLUP02_11982 [Colletotrichum lupini]|uniref:Uncharacterized protein n=1 Tax=Colletotrichum lupini TaxID=145971 RepID=A0A9Q8WKC9_9PEZI|nr:uncharacterized protein CLUP02_11982 [Colletotrichum lupini]UQC86481.1 hypothetical protein CLUP02_11982 [Colletotrichum lupini]